jgi:glyoxylase-like metal-dependent hydrolase (beta-lactamase superfamily II)
MIFRQLFDRDTCTYTYILGDESSGEAIIIDPVRELIDRDTALLEELGLELLYSIETHVHADHITASGMLKERLGCKTVLSANCSAPCVDVCACEGDVIEFGRHKLHVLETHGHTNTCNSYFLAREGMIFTGDALFVRGCGRTDFQAGDARELYRSVHHKIFSLPPATLIYPGHDYNGHTVSTVGEEIAYNPRLGGGRSEDGFVAIMDNLDLSPPDRIDIAVPANENCGLTPPT